MTDNLRDRIAAAIYGVSLSDADPPWERVPDRYRSGALAQADAVIRELRLNEAAQDCRCQLRHVWETSND